MHIYRPWIPEEVDWCLRVHDPLWPFSYEKNIGQVFEHKGRETNNSQNLGVYCNATQALRICHICEDFNTTDSEGYLSNYTSHMQIQGANWTLLNKNIPVAFDTPYVAGGTHKNDYGRDDKFVCVIQDYSCLDPTQSPAKYYSSDVCSIRCWGENEGKPFPVSPHPSEKELPFPTEQWEYNKRKTAQGFIDTLAGTGVRGYKDGFRNESQFDLPKGVTVGLNNDVYVADTGNHCIRLIREDNVSTVIGKCGTAGFADGGIDEALFSSPTGIDFYYETRTNNNGDEYEIVYLIVADTNNHKIRKVYKDGDKYIATTLSGTRNITTETNERKTPQYGFSDGDRDHARFSYPQDVAVTPDGVVYVADTLNYAIRMITPDGNTTTIAGHRIIASNIPGCPEPCERFQQGFKDGSTEESEFYYPIGISLGPNNTILVTDQNRIRMITPKEVMSTVQNITSYNRVVTLAGNDEVGERDGRGELATFQNPKGIMMAGDGSIYVADGSCRIRRLRSEHDVALEIKKDMKFNYLVRPSGCMSRDFPIDRTNYRLTPHIGHIEYSNYSLIGLLNLPCVGVPTDYDFVTTNYTLTNNRGGTGYGPNYNMSDLDIGTSYRIRCPESDYSGFVVKCNGSLCSDNSYVCQSARKVVGITNDNLYKLIVREGAEIEGMFYTRTFSIEAIDEHIVETHTLAGIPTSPLDDGCGYLDNIPATKGRLSLAYDLAMLYNTTLTNENYMYIADTENNVIRYMTATCTFVCENNGTCDGPDHCSCTTGWTGYDCSIPEEKSDLDCGPGYVKVNDDPIQCEPTCVQDCGLHGKCTLPDTCTCDEGWYDANCTTPVCLQTCGNGGNCTANNTCTCPQWWTGDDCRTPVCTQDCNHGICIAPNTCMCNHEWSGYDCSKPICHQGYLVPYDDDDEENFKYWPTFVPCNYSEWCNDTSMFDCQQRIREQSPLVPAGAFERNITGFKELPTGCFRLEFNLSDPYPLRYFKYEISLNNFTNNMIHQGNTPFPDLYPEYPDIADSDRQVALVELKNMAQGYYVCANGGTCYNPEQCDCTRDWVGFDCRTPVCRPSYFEEGNDEEEYKLLTTVQGYPRWQHNDMVKQGEYRCSIRAMTEFEHYWCYSPRNCSDYIWNYPTYYSHYMDCPNGTIVVDGEAINDDCENENYWTNKWPNSPYGWPAVHIRSSENPDLDTNEGYLKRQTWKTSGERWRKGNSCTVLYHRVCKNDTGKVERLYNETIYYENDNLTIINTNITFRPVIEDRHNTNDTFLNRTYGRWFEDGGECIDEVIGGCWNNGTCVSPDVCVCAEGWTGKDCREPICNNTCVNGVCTYPNECTCNRGWEGPDCDIPICAQNCTGPDTNNETDPLSHGRCVGPDLCECKKWNSTIFDNRRFWGYVDGKPFYRDNYNNSQLTGWTGYDCSTPICVQAEKFVFNKPYGKYAVGFNQSILHGHEPQNNIDGEEEYPYYPLPVADYTGEYCRNDGSCYQTGCLYGWNSTCNVTLWEAGNYPNRSGVVNYYNYTWLDWENWDVGVAEPGEGIYVCYNYGSCVAPDTCSCQDGWEGFNCSIPQCRHRQPDSGEIVGCLNGGICSDRDNCTCMQTPSLLYDKYPELSWKNPGFITGWNGSDCSMPMCVQGWYDVNCTEPGISDAGEGCYRCPNGGLCTAPDYCSCPPEWTGYDCRKPVCSVPVTGNLLYQLHTEQIEKIIEFENDPCGENDEIMFNGVNTHRGNCTAPGRCQCLCKERGTPFKDFGLRRFQGYSTVYGREDCRDGYEGEYSEDDEYFVSCHLQIYVPTTAERYTVLIILVCFAAVIILFALWWCISSTWRRYKLVKMVEDRRVKKNVNVAKKLADEEIQEQNTEKKKRDETMKRKYEYDQLLALKNKNLY